MAEWSKLKKETATEYQAFMDYCRMGPQRSIRRLAARYAEQPIPLAKQNSIETYSKKNRWQERVTAWEADQAEAQNAKWLERRLEVRDADWDIAEKLRRLALGILNETPNFMKTRRKLVKGKNGEPDREIVTVGLNLQQALQAAKLASELQWLAVNGDQSVTAKWRTERTDSEGKQDIVNGTIQITAIDYKSALSALAPGSVPDTDASSEN